MRRFVANTPNVSAGLPISRDAAADATLSVNGIQAQLGANNHRTTAVWLLAGVGLGICGAMAMTRLMQNMLFGITATDMTTFTAVSALLSGVALLATYLACAQSNPHRSYGCATQRIIRVAKS